MTMSDSPETPESPLDSTDEVFVEETPDLVPEREPRTPGATIRSATIVSARLIVGVAAVAVAGAVIAAAALAPLASIYSTAPSARITPVPTAQQVVCPGGLLQLSNAEGTSASTASAVGHPTTVSESTTSGPTEARFATSDAGTGGTTNAPLLLTAPPATAASTTPGLLAGAQAQSVSTKEMSGLASAGCVSGSGDLWLSGGSTTVGRTTLLTLADASAVPATVSLEIFGETGAISAPGLGGILVPAGGQRVISLAGFAPDVASPVVHVTSAGGQIVANLQQSTVRGLEPGGSDIVGSQRTASRMTVIPGVLIANAKAVQSRIGESGFDDLSTVLRVFVPDGKDTTAHVSVVAEDGKTEGNAFQLPLTGGRVSDLALDDAAANGSALADGSYTFVITTTDPIVASIRVSTVGSAAVKSTSDFAWFSPAQLLEDTALVSAPASAAKGMTSVLHLANPTKSVERVSVHGGSGSDRLVTVQPGQATSLAVGSGHSYRLSGFAQLYASVTSQTDGGVSGFDVSPPQQSSGVLKIYG
jgi:hypothetical protein